MNIGIDIDGVLTNEHSWHIRCGSQYLGKKPINKYGFTTREIFGVTKEVEDEFWNKNVWKYAEEEKPRADVSKVINKLHSDGNKIYIITARAFAYLDNDLGNKMKNIVKEWFRKNNIFYDKIVFTNTSKLSVCKENNIDIMIEDNVDNINEISKELTIICMDHPYNKNCVKDNIFRCNNWKEIYETINRIN